MSVVMAGSSGIIRDDAQARERILSLEQSAEVHERACRPIQAGACRRSANLLRALWEIPS
jgi:hypothetical protein